MQEKDLSVTRCVLELDRRRRIVSGSRQAPAEALDRGADLLTSGSSAASARSGARAS